MSPKEVWFADASWRGEQDAEKNASQQHVRRHSSHDVGHHERTDHSFYAAEQAALATPACGPALGLDQDSVLE
jgi:hypothetical protein